MSFDQSHLPVMDILLGKVTQQAMNYAIRYLRLPTFGGELLLNIIDPVSQLLPVMLFASPQGCSRYSCFLTLQRPKVLIFFFSQTVEGNERDELQDLQERLNNKIKVRTFYPNQVPLLNQGLWNSTLPNVQSSLHRSLFTTSI